MEFFQFKKSNTNFYEWLIIIILSIVTSLLLLTLALFELIVYKNKIQMKIEEECDHLKNISPCEHFDGILFG